MIDYIAILRRVARDDMALPDNMEWHELFNGAADEIERLRAALQAVLDAALDAGDHLETGAIAWRALEPSSRTELPHVKDS